LNIYFLPFRIFEQLALALKNTSCPELTALNIYFLSFRIFEQLALALKFFKTRRRPPPPRLVRLCLRFKYGGAKFGSCPGRHLNSLRPWYHADLLRNHGLHCWDVTRGKGAQLSGRRKSHQYHKCILQCSTFTSERPQVRTWGRQSCFFPRAPSTSLRLCCTGSISETVFWLCKLPESCVSYKFSIAFLFSLLLFLSKLPSSIINELVTKIYLHSSATSPELC